MDKRLLIALGLLGLFAVIAGAAAPQWWVDQNVLTADAPIDYAPVNQGQLKHFAKAARDEMLAKHVIPAGHPIDEMVEAWRADRANAKDYAPVNLGQLRAVAKPFYDRLIELGLRPAGSYPWADSPEPSTDYAMANAGQVKNVFSFDIPEPEILMETLYYQQEVAVNQDAPFGLTALLTHGGEPVNGVEVTFELVDSTGNLFDPADSGTLETSLAMTSGTNGQATCGFKSPSVAAYCWIRASVSVAEVEPRWFLMIVAGGSGAFPTHPPGAPSVDFSEDSDNDGLSDAAELAQATDPQNADTDGDGWTDGDEAENGGDPKNPGATPNEEMFVSLRTWYRYQEDTWSTTNLGTAGDPKWSDYRHTILNGTETTNHVFNLTSRPTADLSTYEVPSNWPAPYISSPPYGGYVIGSVNSYKSESSGIDNGYKSWHAITRKAQLITTRPLKKDYQITYEVVRHRTPSSGSPTTTVIGTRTLTLVAGSLESEVETFSYAPVDMTSETHDINPLQEYKIEQVTIEEADPTPPLVAIGNLTSDDGVEYKAPHWQDKDGDGVAVTSETTKERNYPVAVRRGAKLSISAKFRTRAVPHYGFPYEVQAAISGGLDFPELEAVAYFTPDGYLTLQATETEDALPNEIAFYNAQDNTAFTIEWKIRSYSVGPWVDAGTTKHTMYVTKAGPTIPDRYETMFNLACRKAAGQSDNNQTIVDAVFSEFTERRIYKVVPSSGTRMTEASGAKPLKYSHGSGATPEVAESVLLIQKGEGRCGTWAVFFQDLLRIHAIAVEQITLYPKHTETPLRSQFSQAFTTKYGNAPTSFSTTPGLFVHHWDLSDHWSPKPKDSPEGIPAQGIDDPYSLFKNHVLNVYGQFIYDPSYGGSYKAKGTTEENLLEWEDASLAGVGVEYYVPATLLPRSGLWIATPNLSSSRETSLTKED